MKYKLFFFLLFFLVQHTIIIYPKKKITLLKGLPIFIMKMITLKKLLVPKWIII